MAVDTQLRAQDDADADTRDNYLRQLRAKTENPRKSQSSRSNFLLWFRSLFIVRLWRAISEQIIRSIESSDPLAISSFDADPPGGDARETMQKLVKTNQRLRLRRLVAKWAIVFVVVQLLCSNYLFWRFLEVNLYRINDPVMIAWLSACVVEVIGILVVIARSLFPKKDQAESVASR